MGHSHKVGKKTNNLQFDSRSRERIVLFESTHGAQLPEIRCLRIQVSNDSTEHLVTDFISLTSGQLPAGAMIHQCHFPYVVLGFLSRQLLINHSCDFKLTAEKLTHFSSTFIGSKVPEKNKQGSTERL